MEYTNEFLSRMFAAYMPCEAVLKGTGEVFRMVGVSHDSGNFESQPLSRSQETDWWNIDPFQLSLTALSAITDEHAIEVARIYASWVGTAPLDIEDVAEWLRGIMTGNCATTADYVSGQQMQQIIDYLRSKSYDLGFQEIKSLIEAGLAITSKS